MLKILYFYAKQNLIIGLIGIYFIVSIILRSLTGIDICIPCVWRTLFDIECFGCGLTTAFQNLIQLNLSAALKSNWLIIVIVPLGLTYIIQDFVKFKNNCIKSKDI